MWYLTKYHRYRSPAGPTDSMSWAGWPLAECPPAWTHTAAVVIRARSSLPGVVARCGRFQVGRVEPERSGNRLLVPAPGWSQGTAGRRGIILQVAELPGRKPEHDQASDRSVLPA